jgi:hypothetical protein
LDLETAGAWPLGWVRRPHSQELADHIAESADAQRIELAVIEGETRIAGQKLDEDEE